MFARFRRRLIKPELVRVDDKYVVRFTDGAGKQHGATFETKREARLFARHVRRLPEEEEFDSQQIAELTAAYTRVGALAASQAWQAYIPGSRDERWGA